MSTTAHSSSTHKCGTGGGTGVPPVHPPTKHSPPPIPPDKEPQLYNAFFDGQSSLVDIAREFNLSVTHLVAWTTQQHVQTKLLNVAELGRTRARLLASEGCGRAVHTLDTISTFHMSDTGDARTTSAHAKRKDVSRKSATDTLKLGLLPLKGLFKYVSSDDNNDNNDNNTPEPTDPTSPQPKGLTAHSRGVERGSASDTPGRHAPHQPHSEGVHEAHRAEKPTPASSVASIPQRHSQGTVDSTSPAPPKKNQAPQPGPDLAATHPATTTNMQPDRQGGPDSTRGPPNIEAARPASDHRGRWP